MQNNIFLVVLLTVIVFGVANFGTSYADTVEAIQNGDWEDPNTWNSTTIPDYSDNVIIPIGFTVNATDDLEIEFLTNQGILYTTLDFDIDYLTNQGIINIGDRSNIYNLSSNSGEINILDSGKRTTFRDDAYFNNSGNLTNFSEIRIREDITINNTGSLVNYGNFLNEGLVLSTEIFHNWDTVDNSPAGEFKSLSGADFTNHVDSSLANFGLFTNFDIFLNEGEITNDGNVTNAISGTFTNDGDFFYGCDGIVGGTILGTQPIRLCSEDPPAFTSFPSNSTVPTDPGKNYAIFSYSYPLAFDGEDPATVFLVPPSLSSGSQFPLGINTVTFEAIDAGGQFTIKSFTVTVVDLQPPVFTGTPADIITSTDPGQPNAIVTWTPPTATDNVAVTSFTSTHSPGDTFPLGPTTVTYTATDGAGNTSIASFTITVNDTEFPVITGIPADITVSTDPGLANAIVTWTPPTATDNVAVTSFTSTHSPGDTFPLGPTTVTYTATDGAGNTSIASFTITVNDTEFPVITLNGLLLLELELNVDTYTELGATVTDNDPVYSETAIIGGDVVDTNTVGVYVVTYDAPADAAGNTPLQITRTVTVIDSMKPIITLNGDSEITLIVGIDTYTELGATVTDNDPVYSETAIIGGDVVDTNTVGVYVVTYDAPADAAGNTPTQVTRTVNVTLGNSPTITILGNNPEEIPVGGVYVDAGATCLDVEDGPIAVDTTNNVDTQSSGTQTVDYSCTDSSGNTVSETRTVEVKVASIQAEKSEIIGKLQSLKSETNISETIQNLDKAIKHIEKSLDSKLWNDELTLDSKHGHKSIHEEGKAVKKLMKILKDDEESPLFLGQTSDIILEITTIDRNFAKNAIETAEIIIDDSSVKYLQKAMDDFEDGLAYESDSEFDKAIDSYEKAWKYAQKALKKFIED